MTEDFGKRGSKRKFRKIILGFMLYFASLIIALPAIILISMVVSLLTEIEMLSMIFLGVTFLLLLLIYTGIFISLARRLLGFRARVAEGDHSTADVQPASNDTPQSWDPGAGLAFGVGWSHLILRVVLFVVGSAGALFGVGAATGWWGLDSEYLDGAPGGWLNALFIPLVAGVVIFSRFVLPALMARSAKSVKSTPNKLMLARAKERSRTPRQTAAFGCGWLLLGGFIVIPTLFAVSYNLVFLLLGEEALTGSEENGDPAFILTAALLVTLMIAVSVLWPRLVGRRRMGRTVLWLRRFHREGRFPFDLVLDDICRGLAVPLTVADTTVSKAELSGRLHWATHVGGWVLGVSFFAGGFTALGGLGDRVSTQQALTVAGPAILLGIALTAYGLRIGGRMDLREDIAKQRMERLFAAIDQKKRLDSTLTVVRLSDENWQRWVGAFIGRADAVVIDVTDLNDNLGWELNTCRERLPPGALVLACGQEATAEEDPWQALEAELERFLGAEYLAGCQRFVYRMPRNLGVLERVLGRNKMLLALHLTRRYEAALLSAVSSAFDAKDARTASLAPSG